MRKVIIMGAGGRDFHDFNVVFRDDPETQVVAFTAAQIPGIDDRTLPAVARRAALPGRDPDPCPRSELAELIVSASASTRSCSPTPTSRTRT